MNGNDSVWFEIGFTCGVLSAAVAFWLVDRLIHSGNNRDRR